MHKLHHMTRKILITIIAALAAYYLAFEVMGTLDLLSLEPGLKSWFLNLLVYPIYLLLLIPIMVSIFLFFWNLLDYLLLKLIARTMDPTIETKSILTVLKHFAIGITIFLLLYMLELSIKSGKIHPSPTVPYEKSLHSSDENRER